MDKKIETSKFSHQDGREKILNAAKKEEAAMSLYSQAEYLFGTKRWEDDWLRIYLLAAPAGYIGNVVSIVLGVSGGVFLAYQLTSNWAAAVLIGMVVTLIMEAAKSVSLREGVIHALKGKSSAVVLFSVAGAMLLASAYFSVESGKKTPYFQKWVQAESGVAVVATPTLSDEQNERLKKIGSDLKAIENERASYEARNPTKTAKWLKADSYERLLAEREHIVSEQSQNSAEKQTAAAAAIQAKTADSLSWWYWCIVLLSELCVVFGYCFRPYYLYRCRELAIAEGKSIHKEVLEVNSAPTHYEAVQVQVQHQQQPLTELELLKRKVEELERSTPNTPRNKLGFRRGDDTVNTVNTAVNTVNTGTETAHTVVITEDTPLEMLLATYRASHGSKQSRKGRETEQASIAIKHHEDRMEKVLSILKKRGLTIKLINRAFTIVPINA